MGVKIIYFVHGTTTDNESGKCTGWLDGELSELGMKQAKELKKQAKERDFEVIFCSDLKRAVDSANFGFKGDHQIIQDKRLRECDYGDFTQFNEDSVDYVRHIDTPFPNGESMKDVEKRIKDFINYLKKEYDNRFIAVMSHKAPQLALEVLLNEKTWERAIDEDWRKKKAWQPGWVYNIN